MKRAHTFYTRALLLTHSHSHMRAHTTYHHHYHHHLPFPLFRTILQLKTTRAWICACILYFVFVIQRLSYKKHLLCQSFSLTFFSLLFPLTWLLFNRAILKYSFVFWHFHTRLFLPSFTYSTFKVNWCMIAFSFYIQLDRWCVITYTEKLGWNDLGASNGL